MQVAYLKLQLRVVVIQTFLATLQDCMYTLESVGYMIVSNLVSNSFSGSKF